MAGICGHQGGLARRAFPTHSTRTKKQDLFIMSLITFFGREYKSPPLASPPSTLASSTSFTWEGRGCGGVFRKCSSNENERSFSMSTWRKKREEEEEVDEEEEEEEGRNKCSANLSSQKSDAV